MSLKSTMKDLSPPILLKLYQRSVKRYGFFGDYASWEEAARECGNKSTTSLEVAGALHIRYREGRDFPELWAWPLYAGLMRAASRNGNSLCVLDFGGSLGGTYFQFLKFSSLANITWCVVELPDIVAYGQRHIEGAQLKFFETAEEVLCHCKPDVLICSGVLQYLKNPYEAMVRLLQHPFADVFLDRVPVLAGQRERIMIQRISPECGGGSVPVRFLSEEKLMAALKDSYSLLGEHNWGSPDTNKISDYKCYLFGKKYTQRAHKL